MKQTPFAPDTWPVPVFALLALDEAGVAAAAEAISRGFGLDASLPPSADANALSPFSASANSVFAASTPAVPTAASAVCAISCTTSLTTSTLAFVFANIASNGPALLDPALVPPEAESGARREVTTFRTAAVNVSQPLLLCEPAS